MGLPKETVQPMPYGTYNVPQAHSQFTVGGKVIGKVVAWNSNMQQELLQDNRLYTRSETCRLFFGKMHARVP